jgi:hypothetical protein
MCIIKKIERMETYVSRPYQNRENRGQSDRRGKPYFDTVHDEYPNRRCGSYCSPDSQAGTGRL